MGTRSGNDAKKMNYDQFTQGFPFERALTFNSVEEWEEQMLSLGFRQKLRQVGRGTFRSDLAIRATDQADLFMDRQSTKLSMQLEAPEGTIGFCLGLSASCELIAAGENIANDKLLMVPGGAQVDIWGASLSGFDAISIPKARFDELCNLLCPSSCSAYGIGVYSDTFGELSDIRSSIQRLIAVPESDISGEQLSNLIAKIVTLVGSAANHSGGRDTTSLPAKTHIAKRARDYIEENYDDAIRIEDLCRVTNAGTRKLQRCFRDYFQLTISEYVKTVRLDAVHRDLRVSERPHTNITELAMKHGFGHLGRFSAEFRNRFGEKPSTVLDRSCSQTRSAAH